MSSLSPFVLRTAGPAFMPHSTVLRAGPLTLLLEQGEVRRVCFGDTEALRRIYLAVRGPDWRTIPPVLADLSVDAQPDSFRVSYSLAHKQDEYDFAWKVEITGEADGRLRFSARGRAGTAFSTNRVGMCLLHPPATCAGREARWEGPDGSAHEGRFPDLISPHEPFKEIQSFSHPLQGDTWLRLAYEGEVFEMEDQRNWTDGSFKSYCPPQDRPKPRRIAAGWETEQIVTLTLHKGVPAAGGSVPAAGAAVSAAGAAVSAAGAAVPAAGAAVPAAGAAVPAATAAVPAAGAAVSAAGDRLPRIRLTGGSGPALPALGFGMASHGRPLGPVDSARIRSLAPAHLRADFRLDDPRMGDAVAAQVAGARALGIPLEAALVVGEDVEGSLEAFADAWERAGGEAARWLVFHRKSDSTPESVLTAAWKRLQALAPRAEFALGSKNDFVLLNRGRPALREEPSASAALAYAMCPQVHAFDNRNIVEALEGQAWTLRTARALWPENRLAVSTVSIKRTPFAASLKLAGAPGEGDWIKQADPRQLSLFAAGWTLGSLRRLAEGGAASATYFETTGPLGLMAGETCPPDLRDYPGVDYRLQPGWVFPVFHVFADLAPFRHGRLLAAEVSHPLRCEALAVEASGRSGLHVANLDSSPVKVRVEGLKQVTGMRRMNGRTAMRAVAEAEAFRDPVLEKAVWADGAFELDLEPYEVVWADVSGA